MTIWFLPATPADLNAHAKGTMIETLGIEVLEVGEDCLTARMPVDRRTIQPAGLLHGGASVSLAETLGSVASTLCLDPSKKYCVGLEINANHVRAVRSGYVYGTARPLHIGSRTHLWEIRIVDDQERLVCISRLTMAILDREEQARS